MRNAQLTSAEDLKYKGGYVQCACGWRKELGDGFNGYHIDACPSCSDEIATRTQDRVTVGKPGAYEIKHGSFVYFVIDGCIHVQYSGNTYRSEYKKRLPR